MPSRDEKLQMLHDGELSATDAAALRGELTPDDERKLAALGELDQLLNETLSTEADAHPIDLWAGLGDKLPELKRAKEATVVPLRRRLGFRLTAGTTSALAMAAAMMLWLRAVPTVNNHVDVEELEVAGSNAAVLSVADDHGGDTTLIWFDHQEDDQWETL